MSSINLKEQVKNLPHVPGVYMFYDSKGAVIYVGKAKNLKNRVSSYFLSNIPLGSKTKKLVDNIKKLSFIEVFSELEALILEAELIKTKKPKYNINLKDDKSYKYIIIKDDKVDGNSYPLVLSLRQTDLKDEIDRKKVKYYFGPYADSKTVAYVLRNVRKIISFRDCTSFKFKKYQKLGSPCLYGHIGVCPAPCIKAITPADYKKNIDNLKKFLSGDSKSLLSHFKVLMQTASKSEDYETAAYYRDILKRYEYVTQKIVKAADYIENPNLVEDKRNEALESLVDSLPILTALPRRIECYDISNISGTNATASLTVAIDGKIDNKEYKRYKIKTKDTPDDFAMIREVISRRVKREDWPKADLFVIDGGKGQVSAALDVVTAYGIDITVVGLAKKYETLVYKDKNEFFELVLPRTHAGLKLLQALRDEAHRFAKKYHHLLRTKSIGLK